MTDIFTLGIKADTSDVVKGKKALDDIADSADKAEKKTGEFRKGVNTAGKAVVAFGVTAATALGVLTVQAANAAREIDNLSRLTGLSTEEFQRTAFAARAYGIEQDKLSDILKDTQDKVGDFLTTGAGPMVDFFEKVAPLVGVTAENFRDLSGKDALQLYVSSLEEANLSQSEMVFFMEAIASDATLLQPLLANNGEELKRLADRASELGLILDELDLNNLNEMKSVLDEVTATGDAAANVIGATLAPIVTDLGKRFLETNLSANDLREGVLTVVEAGVAVAGVFADAGRVLEVFGLSVAAMAVTVVESFGTIDTRLELAKASFDLFFFETDKAILDWVNSQGEAISAWASNMVNALDAFDLFDDVSFAPVMFETEDVEENIERVKEQMSSLEVDLTQSNDLIAQSWADVVALMSEPLPSDQFKDWFENIKRSIVAQRELQEAVEDTGDASSAAIVVMNKDFVKFLGNAKEVTKGLGSAFGENEKAAKALHKVNQVIAIAEQAMILQKVISDNAETQSHLANSAAKATANATEAVTAAASAPFPVGFAAAAAMIGLMASVLGGFGGGSASVDPTAERQETQGTGTVFGSDEKSQSIINSQERFEDIAIDQLAELRGIRNSINSLASGIEQLAGSVIAGGIGEFSGSLSSGSNFNLFTGIFGSKSQTIVDEGINFVRQTLGDIIDQGIVQAQAFFSIETTKKKLFGLITSTSTDTEFQDIDSAIGQQMADIFGHIGDTVIEAARLLGFETVEVVQGGLSQSLGDIFGRGFGSVFDSVFGGISETVELSLEEALSRFTVDIGMVSLEGLSGEEIQQELEAVFSKQADLIAEFLVPSIAEYQQVGEGLFDTLLRVTEEQIIFNDSLDQMGISLSDLSNVVQIDIAQSIIQLIGGAERFRDLTREFFSEFFTEAEQFEQLTMSITEAVSGLGLSMFDSREDFRAMVEGLDRTTEAGQALFASLLELVPSMDEYFDVLERNSANEAAEAEEALNDARRASIATTKELERGAQSAFSGLSGAIRREQNERRSELSQSLADIEADFGARRGAIQDRISSQITSMERQLSAANGQVSALNNLSNILGNSINQVVGLGRAQARALIRGAIDAAQGGQNLSGMDLQGAISSLSNVDQSQFGSALQFQVERARTADELGQLKALADDQLSEAEQAAIMIERQIEAIRLSGENQILALNELQEEQEAAAQEKFDEEIAALDATLENAREQLDALLDIDTSVRSLVEAQQEFTDSIRGLIIEQNIRRSIAEALKEGDQRTTPPTNPTPLTNPTNNAAGFSNSDVLTAIAVSSAKTAKLLGRWDGDGQPETRDTA